MEDLIIQGVAQTIFEMSEGAFSWDKMIADACIEPVVFPFNRVAYHIAYSDEIATPVGAERRWCF